VDSSVVEPIDVLQRFPLDVLDVSPGSLGMDQFGLVETVEALDDSLNLG
jgi:hypothetical protein